MPISSYYWPLTLTLHFFVTAIQKLMQDPLKQITRKIAQYDFWNVVLQGHSRQSGQSGFNWTTFSLTSSLLGVANQHHCSVDAHARPPSTQVTYLNLRDGCKLCKRTPLSLPSNNFLFFQANNYSLTSLICNGCGLRDQRKIGKPKPVLYNTTGRKGRYFYTCETRSVIWPPRSIILTQEWPQKQSHSL